MSIIKGGAAGFNSVVFYSNNFSSKAIRNKEGSIIVNISQRKLTPKLELLISGIPLIRGLYLFVRPMIVMWKMYLMIFLPLLVFLLLASHNGGRIASSLSVLSIIADGIQNHFLLLIAIILVILGVVIKLSNLGKYHGAEHMTDTSYNKLSSIAISDVVKQSRIHAHCGTNFIVFLIIIFFILSFFITDIIVLIMLSICLGYEVFLIQMRILVPFYWIGGFFQHALFTSKPSIEHLEVAIASYDALLKAERNYKKV